MFKRIIIRLLSVFLFLFLLIILQTQILKNIETKKQKEKIFQQKEIQVTEKLYKKITPYEVVPEFLKSKKIYIKIDNKRARVLSITTANIEEPGKCYVCKRSLVKECIIINILIGKITTTIPVCSLKHFKELKEFEVLLK